MIHFIDCVNVSNGKTETIVSKIVKLFASTRGGARPTRNHNPNIMHIHCIAHRLALAAGQACRDI